MRKELWLSAVLLAVGGASARAAVTVNISTNVGTPHVAGMIASFEPTGEDMAGMAVTALFGDGFSQTVTWAAGPVGSKAGAATGSGWSLSETGDTFGGAWTLSTSRAAPLMKLVIDGAPGDTVFDLKNLGELTPGPGMDTGSVGSERGWTFDLFNASIFNNFAFDVIYSNRVSVGADPPVGDLWTTMTLDFSIGGGLQSGFDLIFFADTDLSAEPLVTDLVPEPASGAAFGGLAALLGASLLRRRVKRA